MAKNNSNQLDGEEELQEALQHSASHILAAAVKRIYPEVKIGIGPAIENGFYHDFEFPEGVNISEADFPKIEKEMQKIIDEDQEFVKSMKSAKEARELMEKEKESYKLEILKGLVDQGEKEFSFYQNGDYISICKGPHVKRSSEIKAFKLLSVAGAYWKGDEKNQMLSRIYGAAFNSKKEMKEHMEMIEKLKQNDHRKLGQELDLFCFSDLVGPGLPMYTPRGVAIKEAVQKHIEKVCYKYGFRKVMAPPLAKIKLFEISGHAKKYPEELFRVESERYEDLVMKPVQCPHHTQIFASRPRSYRELPIRYMESDKQYRAEKSGELSGLNRVIAITVEDGHSFCRVDQVKEEVKIMVNIIKDFYSAIGLWGRHWVSLSVRDYDHPENYIGSPEDWDKCEEMLQEVSDEMKLDAKRCEGEAALYGPKLDFMFKDSLGREIQIPTVQLDFATPKKFELSYVDETGKKVAPVMVHRAILGSYERFLVLLIENFGGAFPLWMAPEQVRVLPVKEDQNDYAQDIVDKLEDEGVRVERDIKPDALSAKIKSAQQYKVPYMVILGEKEEKAGKISVRSRDGKESHDVDLDEFVADLKSEIEEKRI